MLEITLQNLAGRSVPVELKEKFDLTEFKKVVEEVFTPIDRYRFFIDSIQLNLEDENKFNEQKSKIQDDKTIFVLGRLRGGGLLDLATFSDIIFADLPDELKKIKKTNYQCAVCCLNSPCIKVCHAMTCEQCFINYFKTCNLQIKCLICSAIVSPKNVFVTREFIASLRSYDELKNLLKHIDCQVCSCGTLVINETMYPKQRCINTKCSRVFCFFCNKNWNDQTMCHSNKYTCSSGNCTYETYINFNPVPFKHNVAFQIPNRRCCPQCSTPGAYDEKCKFNTCLECDHRFCFFCLQTEEVCVATYGGYYATKCVEPVKQTYAVFPRLNNS